MRKTIIAALLAAVALLGAAPAQADDRIPNLNCPLRSPCFESYNQGLEWTIYHGFLEARRATTHGGAGERQAESDIFGPGAIPEVAAAFCRGQLAEAIASGHAPTHPRMFLGGCFDFVLGEWINAGDTSYLEARQWMVHA